LVAALLAAASARAGEGESDPLESQRSLVRSLRDQSGNAEAVFGVYAGLARVSAARAAAISTQMRVLSSRLAAAEAEEALARAVLESRGGRVRPRRPSLYRVPRRSPPRVRLPA